MAGVLSVTEPTPCLPVVPMFHANAWGFPFTCTFVGAKQVFPGPFLDGESLLEAFQQEQVDHRRRADDLDADPPELDADPSAYDTPSAA